MPVISCIAGGRGRISFCISRRTSEGIRPGSLRSSQEIWDSSAFQPRCLPTAPPTPARPGSPGLALPWRHGSATVVVPWGALPMVAPSHRQASSQLTSPSSKRAENPSLRRAGAVPLGPTGKAAREVGGGDCGAGHSGHVPRHLNQSRSRPGLRDAPFWLALIPGRCQKLRPEGELRTNPEFPLPY